MLVAAALVAYSASAKAVVIAYWDFNDGDLIADQGAGTITPTLLNNMDLQFVAGTTVNALSGVSAGQALKVNKTSSGFSQFQLDIEFDMTGFVDPVITAALRADPSWRSNPSVPTGIQVTWVPSANGGTSFFLGLQFVPDADFTSRQVSQLSFNNLGGSADALVRVQQNPSSVTTDEGFYIDNLLITATEAPQPPSVAEPGTLIVLGIGLAAIGFVRRRKMA